MEWISYPAKDSRRGKKGHPVAVVVETAGKKSGCYRSSGFWQGASRPRAGAQYFCRHDLAAETHCIRYLPANGTGQQGSLSMSESTTHSPADDGVRTETQRWRHWHCAAAQGILLTRGQRGIRASLAMENGARQTGATTSQATLSAHVPLIMYIQKRPTSAGESPSLLRGIWDGRCHCLWRK